MVIVRSVMLLACMTGSLFAQDVAWLKDVTTPPETFSLHHGGAILPVDRNSEGEKISQWEDWRKQRDELRRHWLKFLGPMPEPRPGVQLEVLQSGEVDKVVRQLVRYEGEPGLPVEGYLLFPKEAESSGKTFPAIIGLHQTTDASIDEIAGVSGPDAMQIGLKLAQRGYVVFCPRCFLWQNATSLNDAVEQHRKRHPQTLGMAKMLYDAMRGVDVLESLPFVDKTRIGSIGHSLGAKEVLYLMAFDDRVRAGVASEGGIAFRSTNWNAPWYLGTAIDDESFPLNHHQLLAMIAPRPFLVLGGESGPGAADGDRSWVLIDAAMPVWRLSGQPVRIGLLNHNEGHSVSPLSFERMTEWLDAYVR